MSSEPGVQRVNRRPENLEPTAVITVRLPLSDHGRLKQMAGAAGNLEMAFTAGNPVALNWTFNGKFLEDNTSYTLPSPTFPTVQPPRFASATLTIGGTAYKISQATLNLNCEVAMREDATSDDDATRSNDGTGYHAACVVNMDPTLTIDPEAQTSKSWVQDMLDGDTAALSIVVGSDSNNTMTLSAAAVQVNEAPSQDRNGVITDNIVLGFTGSTLFTVAFS